MREVDESLELMKDAYKRRMDFCEERRLQFEAKQNKMRENVIKFEKFIQENDAKRQRAEAKIKQERKIYDQKCQEMNTILSNIKSLEEAQKGITEELDKHNMYTAYLQGTNANTHSYIPIHIHTYSYIHTYIHTYIRTYS